MKPNIHPNYNQVLAKCGCGHEFNFYSTIESKTINIDACCNCHPVYTGNQKTTTVAGRVDKFNRKFQDKQHLAKQLPIATTKKVVTKKKVAAKKKEQKS